MPNKSDPNSTQSAGQSAVPSVFPQSDLPPLPDFATQGTSTPAGQSAAPVTPNPQPPIQPPGSAAPADLPPVISTNPKKKFGGGRLIATILGILVLIGGVGAGILLIQQRQLFQQKAFIPEGGGGEPFLGDQKKQGKGENNPVVVKRDKNGDPIYVQTNPDTTDNDCTGDGLCASGSCTNGSCVSTSTSCKAGDPNAPGCCSNLNEADCDNVVCESGPAGGRKECKSSSGQHCTLSVGSSSGCGGANQPETNIVETPIPSPTPGAPQCLNVKAYSSTWILLTDAELSALTPNTVVNFCVTGSALTGTFDKAQFKINLVTKPETTTKGQGGAATSFCQSYTILSTDTTVNVKAKIHHASLNQWVGETF